MIKGDGIAIEGLQPLMGALGAYPEIVRPLLEQASQAGMLVVVRAVKEYPPAPASSRYIRTGTLGRRWAEATPEFTSAGETFASTLGNNTPYAGYVQGRDDQAWMHIERWDSAEDILEDNRDTITDYFEAAARKACRDIEEAANAAL